MFSKKTKMVYNQDIAIHKATTMTTSQNNPSASTAQDDADDAAWDALMSRPDVIEENERIAREIREAAAKGGLGSDISQAEPD